MSAPTKAKPTEEETKGLGLSPTQVIAGAGASVTSTVFASTAGVGGTLTGAAAGSVVSTVAAALYAHSLKRGREKVTKVIPASRLVDDVRAMPRDELATRIRDARESSPAEIVERQKRERRERAERLATQALPAHLDPRAEKPKRFDIKLDRKFWTKIAIAAVGMFLLVMAIITGIELLTQKPVASLVGNTETSRSTTLGTVTTGTSSTAPEPEDDTTEESPVTTTTPNDEPGREQAEPTTTPESGEQPNEQGGVDITRTAESSQAEPTQEAEEEDVQAPAEETEQAEPTTQAEPQE